MSGTDGVALARECVAVSDGLQLQWVLTDGALDLHRGREGARGSHRAHRPERSRAAVGAALGP